MRPVVRLLLLTAYRTVAGLREYAASRSVLQGLEARGIDWSLWNPAVPLPPLEGFDAVMAWPYRDWLFRNFVHAVEKVERRAAALGLAVVNPVRIAADMRHSIYLRRWYAAGVPCPESQPIQHPSHIRLPYPLILRCDTVHFGESMVLVRDRAEAEAAFAARNAARASISDPSKRPPAFDLAVRFVDTRDDRDGCYVKRRCYVVGSRVIQCHQFRSSSWLVNWASVERSVRVWDEHKRWMAEGEPHADVLISAARAVGVDMVGIDYSPTPDGGIMLWEGNGKLRMWGDEEYEEARLGSTARLRRPDRAYGEAAAELVLERVAASRRAREMAE